MSERVQIFQWGYKAYRTVGLCVWFWGMNWDAKPELTPGILQNAWGCQFYKIISKWHKLWVMLNLPSLKASKLKFSRVGTLHILMQHCLPFIDVRIAENKSQGHEACWKYYQNKKDSSYSQARILSKVEDNGKRKPKNIFNRYPDKCIIYIWRAFGKTVCQMLVKTTSSKKTQ